MGRAGTASQEIVRAVRGFAGRTPIQLVISWGMLARLEQVLIRDLGFLERDAKGLTDAIAGYAAQGPSLTLGGIGVLPILDEEDRHVLETAWAGRAEALVTADFGGFVGADARVIRPERLALAVRGRSNLYIIHPYELAGWLRGAVVNGFDPALTPT